MPPPIPVDQGSVRFRFTGQDDPAASGLANLSSAILQFPVIREQVAQQEEDRQFRRRLALGQEGLQQRQAALQERRFAASRADRETDVRFREEQAEAAQQARAAEAGREERRFQTQESRRAREGEQDFALGRERNQIELLKVRQQMQSRIAQMAASAGVKNSDALRLWDDVRQELGNPANVKVSVSGLDNIAKSTLALVSAEARANEEGRVLTEEERARIRQEAAGLDLLTISFGALDNPQVQELLNLSDEERAALAQQVGQQVVRFNQEFENRLEALKGGQVMRFGDPTTAPGVPEKPTGAEPSPAAPATPAATTQLTPPAGDRTRAADVVERVGIGGEGTQRDQVVQRVAANRERFPNLSPRERLAELQAVDQDFQGPGDFATHPLAVRLASRPHTPAEQRKVIDAFLKTLADPRKPNASRDEKLFELEQLLRAMAVAGF